MEFGIGSRVALVEANLYCLETYLGAELYNEFHLGYCIWSTIVTLRKVTR